MEYEVYQAKGNPDEWVVGAAAHPPLGEGEMYMAYFEGPRAEQRAREYAAWQSGGARDPSSGFSISRILADARLSPEPI